MVGTDAVAVGSWVLVRDGRDEELWRIVAREDADPRRGRISEASPVALALLGRHAGDQVRVEARERRTVAILRVWTEDADVRVVGGNGAGLVEHGPQVRWQDVLDRAESVRLLRSEAGVALYEVLARSGHVQHYQVEE